ncbi:unnamed protein product, partial [Sphacelaria rigidula]
MSSDVLKAGVLEVTVVQAVGVGLTGSGATLARGRRKPAIFARVTVDGTTKSSPPAPRSHHPVWFPARPPPIGQENDHSTASSRASGGSIFAADLRLDEEGERLPGRRSSRGLLGDGVRDGRFDNAGLLDGTRGRYGGGSGGGGGEASVRGGSVGGVSDVSSGSGGAHGNNSGNVARGLLFEVREFY